jgi:hypothetical protein
MDWANEEYVRLYVRETADDLELSWEATALWRALLTKFDRAGLLPVKNGWASVAKLVRIPADVCATAGAELIADGRVRQIDVGFLAPNFTAAQTASKSDKARQRESRDRRRADAMRQPSETVEARHGVSHAVTPGHAPSQNVTLAYAEPEPEPTPPLPAGDVSGLAIGECGRIAKATWTSFSKARVAVAEEFGIASVMPFGIITPGFHPRGFRELELRIREEGIEAERISWRVLEMRTHEARKTKSVEWLSEKAFDEKPWRIAKEATPAWLARQPANNATSGYTETHRRKDGSSVRITFDATGAQVDTQIIPAEVAS